MKNGLVKALILATMLTSVSAGTPKLVIPQYFIPPPQIKVDLEDWRWMSMGMTGRFHIAVKYKISDGEEIIAHYQAGSKEGDWYTMNLQKDYETVQIDNKK